MGCTFSQEASTDSNMRVFKVFNVDDLGQERNPGKIEITETELILYQRGKDSICWPLRSLRRYGFDAELFSFESGRRCPTGPGIYAFKCRRAEALFNLLQECIQRAGQEEHRTGGSMGDSRPGSLVEAQQQAAGGGGSRRPTDDSHLYINGQIRSHEYVNTAINGRVDNGPAKRSRIDPGMRVVDVPGSLRGSCEHVIQYAKLDLPGGADEGSPTGSPGFSARKGSAALSTSSLPINGLVSHPLTDTLSHGMGESSQTAYINVPVAEGAAPDESGDRLITEDPHNYANLSLLSSGTRPVGLGKGENGVNNLMNYAQLDLEGKENGACGGAAVLPLCVAVPPPPTSPTTHTPGLTPESPRRTDSYAKIDFDRTRALNLKTRGADEGVRKTRHNSNIEECGL